MQAVLCMGERIEVLRMQRALTQCELADRVGISSNALNGTVLSKAEPQMSTPRKLTKALDVDPTNS